MDLNYVVLVAKLLVIYDNRVENPIYRLFNVCACIVIPKLNTVDYELREIPQYVDPQVIRSVRTLPNDSTNHDFVNHYTRRIEFSDSQSIEVRDALAAEAMNIEQVMEIPEEPHLNAVPIPAVFDLNYIINDAVSDVNNELLQLYASIEPSNAELSISELDDLFNFDTTQFD